MVLDAATLDYLRETEEKNYQGLRRVLGKSFELLEDVLALYDVFLKLAVKPIVKLDDASQFAALLHSLHWLQNEAIAGVTILMRGHITDSSLFNRRSLEICAASILIYRDNQTAKRWMEAGNSKRARDRFRSSFPASKLVQDLLSPELKKMYEDDCLDVHPSLFAIAKRASLGDDYVHRFSYFDIDETDGYQTFFVMSFFNLIICHGKIMEYLCSEFEPSGHFDVAAWLAAYSPFTYKLDGLRATWIPIIDAHFAKMDADCEDSLGKAEA